MPLPVAIVIPTHNRGHSIRQAVDAALSQSHRDTIVLVVDDGSTDDTADMLGAYRDEPRACCIRLACNLGTAAAKNVGLLWSGARAVTFHDSDDIPHRDKVLRQARVMAQSAIGADPCLNWALTGRTPGGTLRIGAVLNHHELILPDGVRVEIRRGLSLVDDIFPNLQMGSTVPGDWMHVNSGLFHPDVFRRLGGFSDCIEEDREFRNRLILGGEVVWVLQEILLTKIETSDSLTQSAATDYSSARRAIDRRRVWDAVERWLATRQVDPVPIDLPDLAVAAISNPALLSPSDVARTSATDAAMRRMLETLEVAA